MFFYGRALLYSFREKDRRFILYSVAVVLLPLFTILAWSPRMLAVRYFLPSLMILQMAVAHGLATCRIPVRVTVLSGFICLSLIQTSVLVFEGRSNYGRAFSELQERGVRAFASDNEFRARLMLDHHRQSEMQVAPMAECPEWFLMQSSDTYFEAPQRSQQTGCSREYELKKQYPSAPLSGTALALYTLVK